VSRVVRWWTRERGDDGAMRRGRTRARGSRGNPTTGRMSGEDVVDARMWMVWRRDGENVVMGVFTIASSMVCAREGWRDVRGEA